VGLPRAIAAVRNLPAQKAAVPVVKSPHRVVRPKKEAGDNWSCLNQFNMPILGVWYL